MNILFTCAGRRNYLINYFKEAIKGEGLIMAADMQKTAPAMIDADKAFIVPGIYAENYVDELIKCIKNEAVDLVISLNDLELPILAEHQKEIEETGAKVIISNPKAIKIAFDKWETAKYIERIGLKSPKTYINIDKALEAIDEGKLTFPLVLKPRWGSASIGIDFPESIEELKLAYQLQLLRIKKTILANASKEDLEHTILIQEKIQGKEYGLDVLNDFNGKYYGTFLREKLAMRSGETDKAISVIDDRFSKVGRKIGESLRHLGNLDCDVFEYNNELYVLELNPRFGGGYPFSHEAGMDTASAYIAWARGEYDVEQFNNYKAGVLFSKCDRLLKID